MKKQVHKSQVDYFSRYLMLLNFEDEIEAIVCLPNNKGTKRFNFPINPLPSLFSIKNFDHSKHAMQEVKLEK